MLLQSILDLGLRLLFAKLSFVDGSIQMFDRLSAMTMELALCMSHVIARQPHSLNRLMHPRVRRHRSRSSHCGTGRSCRHWPRSSLRTSRACWKSQG